MEKKSPSSDQKTVAFSPRSPPSDLRTQHFASNFTNLYHSIFPPKPSPLPSATSTPSSSVTTVDDFSTENYLRQGRLILEYQELCDHYEVSLSRLQAVRGEIELLRQENNELRAANNEILKVLSQVSAIRNRFGERDEPNRFERRVELGQERVTLPKSISIRTANYLKLNQTEASNNNAVTRPSQLAKGFNKPRRLCVAGVGVGRRKEEERGAVEVEAYGQGMWKTELCNKWQETGACPYGNNCQFAHGMKELRPVMRHPRYKTQVCRMVLTGETCPYGHRCHFRHALTQQERLACPH